MTFEKKQILSLSDVLYTLDPAGTCCVENESADEYDMEAIEVFALIDSTELSFTDCIKRVINENFDIELSDESAKNIEKCYLEHMSS